MLWHDRSNAVTRKTKSVFNVWLMCIIQRLCVWTHTWGERDPWREADDLTKAWGWWLYGRTLLGLVSCEGECDVTISTFTLFNDAVKLTRFLTTKNYETNDNINTHKISPQIGYALMGFRRRSGLAEGLQSNYNNISIVLTNAAWKKKACMDKWEKWDGSNIYPTTVSDRKSCLKGQHVWRIRGVPSSDLGSHTISTDVA